MENEAWKEYEEEFERRKNEVTTRLKTIKKGNMISNTYRIWLDQAIKFIEETKV